MAFDLASAKPVEGQKPADKGKKGFDLSSAKPVNPLDLTSALMPGGSNVGLDILGGTVEFLGRGVGGAVGLVNKPAGEAISRGATTLGQAIGSPETQAYQKGGGLLGTAPVAMLGGAAVGGALKAGAPLVGRAGPYVAGLGESVATGGFRSGEAFAGQGAANLAGRAVTRTAGGAALGGGTSYLYDPDSALMGTLIGGGIPLGASAVAPAFRAGANWLGSYVAPERTAANALVREAGGQDLVNALTQTQGMRTTPGFTPTMSERFVQGGIENPTLAQIEQALPGASPAVNRQIFEAQSKRVQALTDQIARVETQLRQQTNALAPQYRDSAEAALANLRQQLSQQEAALAQTRSILEQPLARGGQLQPGKQIGERGAELKKDVRTQQIDPAYRAAYTEAGNTPIGIGSVVAEAEQILGAPLARLAPETSATAAYFKRLPVDDQGNLLPVTLKQADEIRKAINLDIAAASSGTAPGNAMQLRNLGQLHKAIDDAVTNSNISDKAKSLYNNALNLYRTEFVPRFKTGLQVDVLGNTRKNVPRLIPDKVVSRVISDESGIQQFNAMFKGDPQATAALKAGIEDLYEQQLLRGADAAESWLNSHRKVFDDLQGMGIDVRSGIQQTQQRAVVQREGEQALASLQNQFGAKNASELIDNLLQSNSNLTRGLQAMDSRGHTALGQEIADRAMAMVNASDAAGAIKFLTDKKAIIVKALDAANPGAGAQIYDDLLTTARFGDEIARVKGKLPPAQKSQVQIQLDRNYSADELADLQVVANDLRRASVVERQGRFGAQATEPDPSKIATESAATAGISAVGAPSFLTPTYMAARLVWKRLEGRINERTALTLARWMYENPDAAIEKLAAAQRRATRSQKATTGSRVAGGLAAGAVNALSPKTNENALME